MAIEDPVLDHLLFELEEALDAMAAEQRSQRADASRRFVSRFFHLGLRLHRSPALLDEARVHQLLERASSRRLWAESQIETHAGELRDLLQESWEADTDAGAFYIDRWPRACTERSALEFLAEYLGDDLLHPDAAALREILDEADETLRARVDRGDIVPHPDEAPAGVPPSHWWWRYDGA